MSEAALSGRDPGRLPGERMSRNKYVKDYRLLESVDERGRVRVEYEYIGRYYEFTGGTDTARAGKKRVLRLCALCWAAFFAALIPVSTAMHTVYVSLPFAFSALPLGMLSASALSIPAGEKLMEHRTADALENALPPRALFAALLSGTALAAQAVRLIVTRDPVWPGDAVFLAAAAAMTAGAAAAFSERKKFSVREI